MKRGEEIELTGELNFLGEMASKAAMHEVMELRNKATEFRATEFRVTVSLFQRSAKMK